MNQKFNLEKIVRENIRDLKPYRSARDDFDSGILLDANENSFGSPIESDLELNRYPMPYQEKLRSVIADYRKVDTANVFVGVGSDEAIDLLFRIFCSPGKDKVITNPPTYGMYKVSANINNIKVDEVLLTPDFQLQTERILNRVTDFTKLIFVCSPNNPTANDMDRKDIIHLLENFDGLVVVDEAYIDFSEQSGFAEEVKNYPNLVVLQTLSKAFGLAGIRLGIAIANPEVINYMMKVKAPYNVNKLTSQAALNGFENLGSVQKNIKSINSEKNRIVAELENLAQVEKVFPSDANFLLFRVDDALNVYKKLADSGVIVRYRGNEPHCENCLRVTIGTTQENDQFLSSLIKILG
ncbi:MAG: histidinol-phosphate transaminase [Balneola sp.]|nr:histidinol-phosphate transaminase [Balneola sp.]MBO6652123.1 histidinol-phosphate transaminase [Balneola sp.]MBO6710015.1 histidinol-phosphate transaminase [Balneola sp.]MBO6798699.1 histidinol-phosphate transaminase [Balneola sp.]MBO6869813.1 histidinol-phosphate transaminase [Balneola sp.]